ncbi:MAG: hypothetical protein HRU40_08720 [Saprospiraceae bacterium]|nr:hypothetical protein [Saprospiraceae bacterium]
MKKLILGLLAVALVVGAVHGQDAKKLEKEANRALGKYNLDQSGNKAELAVAMTASDKAVEADANMGAAWNTRGNVYSAIATQLVTDRQLGMGLSEGLPEAEMPAVTAFDSYKMGLEKALKKFETKDAVKGIQGLMGTLSNQGIFDYEDGNYVTAYTHFVALLNAHELLVDNGEESGLKTEDYNRQMYITGLAAMQGQKMDEAETYFQKLYDMEYDEPAIYEALYTLKAKKTSPEDAYAILEKGKEKYPDDISLLFAEINHYLKLGKSAELIDKLGRAIEAEPENASLYSVMGNAHETLYQNAAEAGNTEEAAELFDKALEWYDKAKNVDPTNITAIYSAGALYYNKAAQLTQKMLEMQDDYSKEGIERYNKMRDEVLGEFENALPYFKQAEQIDPNDLNTLIALKEIFAKKDDLEMSNEFKDRLENVQNGGQNESYFKNE